MSLSSANNRNDYTGNGATATYSYTFRIFDEADLVVTVKDTSDVETTLTLTTDYTVTGVGADGGGNVVLVDASQAWLDGDGDLLTGYTITIRRVVDLFQETDIRNQGEFFPETHEDAFDYGRMVDQQQQDEIDRCLQLPESILPSVFDPALPTDVGTADNVFAVNAAGDGVEMKTADDLMSLAGALLIANNLSDLASVATALVNLDIKPLSQPVTTAVTNSMGATSITGFSFTPGLWVTVEYFITRNSAAVLGSGTVYLHYDGAAWQIVIGDYNYKSGKAFTSGLTWSMSGNQLQVAADATGSGSLITKYHSA